MTQRKALVVATSGISSCGKTTLSRLLRDIFPDTFIVHEDDFCKLEKELPIKHGMHDWDCAESLNIPLLAEALAHAQKHGELLPKLHSKEDQNTIDECTVPQSLIEALKDKVSLKLSSPSCSSLKLCVLDGFLLYSPSMSQVHPYLDVKIFLRASCEKFKARRKDRDGYVTLDGFWTEPPGYIDKVAWPNYLEDHAWMFEDGNFEGNFDTAVLAKENIHVMPGQPLDADLSETLVWMTDLILDELSHHK